MILVDGGDALKSVMKGLDVPSSSGGVGVAAGLLGRQASFDVNKGIPEGMDEDTMMDGAEGAHRGAGGHGAVAKELLGRIEELDPRKYLKIVDAFKQPKWVYNTLKKQFERYITLYPLLSPSSPC